MAIFFKRVCLTKGTCRKQFTNEMRKIHNKAELSASEDTWTMIMLNYNTKSKVAPRWAGYCFNIT